MGILIIKDICCCEYIFGLEIKKPVSTDSTNGWCHCHSKKSLVSIYQPSFYLDLPPLEIRRPGRSPPPPPIRPPLLSDVTWNSLSSEMLIIHNHRRSAFPGHSRPNTNVWLSSWRNSDQTRNIRTATSLQPPLLTRLSRSWRRRNPQEGPPHLSSCGRRDWANLLQCRRNSGEARFPGIEHLTTCSRCSASSSSSSDLAIGKLNLPFAE